MQPRDMYTYRWNPVQQHWQFFNFSELYWQKCLFGEGEVTKWVSKKFRKDDRIAVLTYDDTWAEQEEELAVETRPADSTVPSKGQGELYTQRHLGICTDGPLEPLRVKFVRTPKAGHVVRIPYTLGSPNERIFAVNVNGAWARTMWVPQDERWYIYRVESVRPDSLGDVASLKYERALTP